MTTLPHSHYYCIKKATFCRFDLERETRLELATPTLARLCSTTELFPQYEVSMCNLDDFRKKGWIIVMLCVLSRKCRLIITKTDRGLTVFGRINTCNEFITNTVCSFGFVRMRVKISAILSIQVTRNYYSI